MTEIKSKQQAIINAYGQYWEQLKEHIDDDENGWIKIGWGKYADYELECLLDELKIPLSVKDFDCYCTNDVDEGLCSARLKSLEGIEDNNCWIKIESEADLPKEHCYMWVKEVGSQEINLIRFQTPFFTPIHKSCSHYKPINKPLSPIY